MRIERIRIAGFGPLADLDLEWPDGRLLLVVDRNERGKTSLCEAIVAALYGVPRGRGAGSRLRELRRPRSGAPLRAGIDLVAAGRRWSVDRDLDAGTVRIVDRDHGVEATREFLRPGGRDAFGEVVTGGLAEPLFRATAYVAQNVLDRDTLDSSLTVELARIADSGGGEASVIRAQRLLEAARREMPDARSGPTVSVETEIVRLSRKVEELRSHRTRLTGCRAAAAEASARLRSLVERRDAGRTRAERAALSVVMAERDAVRRRLTELTAAEGALRAAAEEAASLAKDGEAFSPERLAAIDRLRTERGTRPEALRAARETHAVAEARAGEARRLRERRLGAALSLPAAERETARRLLEGAGDAARETAGAEASVEAGWEDLRQLGVADDLRRLEALPPEERTFLQGADDERSALEVEGIRLDRKVAEAQVVLSVLSGERRSRLRQARLLLAVAGGLVPLIVWLALSRVPVAVTVTVGLVASLLGAFAAFGWISGGQYRLEDEERARAEEAASRQGAAEARRHLSELRQRLDRIAHAAGFADGTALLKAQRRLRGAEEARRRFHDRRGRRERAREREEQIGADLAPLREALGLPAGFPSEEAVRKGLALLAEVEEALEEERSGAALSSREAERLDREAGAIARIEDALRAEIRGAGIPDDVPLADALALVGAGRRRAARRAELVEVEIPARRDAADEGEAARLTGRLAALEGEIARRRREVGEAAETGEADEAPLEPEAARRAADAARAALEEAEEACRAAERDLAAAAREGGERAREVEEALVETEALLERATLFRDALDLAQRALADAAASVYGDFRRGLAEASRAILSSWRIPYEGLAFGDDLSVSAVARGGRVATRTEIEAGLSTGAREQLHLTARLAVLRYLGTGAEGVPLLLDDPLTGSDDERFAAVMEFLLERVLGERPVLLASCHGWRHERLLSALPARLADRLAVVSLSADPEPAPA